MKFRYIIIGTARSGKSTLANKLLKQNGGVFLDIVDYVFAFIKRENIPQNESDYSLLKIPYEDLCKDLDAGKEWDILELASDFPAEYLPKIISGSKTPIKLIFCKCALEVCLKRNGREKRSVPEEIMKHQNQYGESFYQNLSSRLGINLTIVDTDKKKVKKGPKKIVRKERQFVR